LAASAATWTFWNQFVVARATGLSIKLKAAMNALWMKLIRGPKNPI
jgi:hypothetical protein